MRTAGLLLAVPLLVAGLGACGSNDKGAAQDPPTGTAGPVPAELKAACGHPGAIAKLVSTPLPVTVGKASCNLAGVIVEWKDGKDTVPGGDLANPAAGTECNGTNGATCPSVTVAKNGDVTIAPSS
jgi:hypothetical protein